MNVIRIMNKLIRNGLFLFTLFSSFVLVAQTKGSDFTIGISSPKQNSPWAKVLGKSEILPTFNLEKTPRDFSEISIQRPDIKGGLGISPQMSGGVTGHGGGGTFIRREDGRLIFWDLYLHNPNIVDDQDGDVLTLSALGAQAKGEWLDYRQLRAAKFISARLLLWREKLDCVVRASFLLRDRVPVFITSFSIPTFSEIELPRDNARIASSYALAGAFYEYSTNRVYIDLDVWNRAGLLSQAALLLHERMRHFQREFGMTNQDIQKTVYQILTLDPKDVDLKDLYPGQLGWTVGQHASLNNEYLGSPSTINKAEAPEFVIRGALANRVLGELRAEGTLNGSIGIRNQAFDKSIQLLLQPATCDAHLSLNHRSPLKLDPVDAFQCISGELIGEGLLRSQTKQNQEFQLAVRISLESNAEFHFEVLKALDSTHISMNPAFRAKFEKFAKLPVSTLSGLAITFKREGREVKVWIGKRLVNITSLSDADLALDFGIRVFLKKQKIEVFQRASNGKTMLIAISGIPAQLLKARGEYWEIGMSKGTRLQYLQQSP